MIKAYFYSILVVLLLAFASQSRADESRPRTLQGNWISSCKKISDKDVARLHIPASAKYQITILRVRGAELYVDYALYKDGGCQEFDSTVAECKSTDVRSGLGSFAVAPKKGLLTVRSPAATSGVYEKSGTMKYFSRKPSC